MQRNPLRNLLVSNKGRGLFRVENSADGSEATVYLYDVIVSDDYWGGVTPLAFAKELAQIAAPVIHLRMNCPGGEVFSSVAMAQAVKEHPATVIVHVDGYAASAATKILVEADKSYISPGGMVMIHKSLTMGMGNADDFTATAALLAKVDGQIADAYARKTGMDHAELLDMMKAETWMTEAEAVKLGFVDSLAEGNPEKAATNKAGWDLSAYGHPPEQPDVAPVLDSGIDEGTDSGAFSISDHLRRKLNISVGIPEGAN